MSQCGIFACWFFRGVHVLSHSMHQRKGKTYISPVPPKNLQQQPHFPLLVRFTTDFISPKMFSSMHQKKCSQTRNRSSIDPKPKTFNLFGKLTWQAGQSPIISNRRYIFKYNVFRCHVSFWGSAIIFSRLDKAAITNWGFPVVVDLPAPAATVEPTIAANVMKFVNSCWDCACFRGFFTWRARQKARTKLTMNL